MNTIELCKTLTAKRAEKGITQEELARYLGVSKASVSKWENGHCYPDITFLPELAAYFDVTLDELLGYQPQLSDRAIRKLSEELVLAFAVKPFDDVMSRCHALLKRYFSCYPLLYQIGILFMNIGTNEKDEVRKLSVITEAMELFVRVKTSSDNMELKRLALLSEAACEVMLRNANKVMVLLEDETHIASHPSVSAILSQSYQILDKKQDARMVLQGSILNNIIAVFDDMAIYASLYNDEADYFDEICRRTMEMAEIFRINKLFPPILLPFCFNAAIGYMANKNTEKALEMLSSYTEMATSDMDLTKSVSDNFFTMVNEIMEYQKKKHPYIIRNISRGEPSIKRNYAQDLLQESAFADLRENQCFQNLLKRLAHD